jgi:hypothetical protein
VKSRGKVPICSREPKGWECRFDEPIYRPDGRKLVTLLDAGTYITKLPKAQRSAPYGKRGYGCPDPVGRKQWTAGDGAHRRHEVLNPDR